jgi:hypothetical protein
MDEKWCYFRSRDRMRATKSQGESEHGASARSAFELRVPAIRGQSGSLIR